MGLPIKPKFGLSVNRGSISNVIFFASLSDSTTHSKIEYCANCHVLDVRYLGGHKMFGNHLAPNTGLNIWKNSALVQKFREISRNFCEIQE